ncbi:hypothetical protein AV521_37600 [Streptomyces sp. IMTB 2501]|nr:hypothetical protein AV521_37600 [Streptomyces sp. IMTB 2501]
MAFGGRLLAGRWCQVTDEGLFSSRAPFLGPVITGVLGGRRTVWTRRWMLRVVPVSVAMLYEASVPMASARSSGSVPCGASRA